MMVKIYGERGRKTVPTRSWSFLNMTAMTEKKRCRWWREKKREKNEKNKRNIVVSLEELISDETCMRTHIINLKLDFLVKTYSLYQIIWSKDVYL